MNVRFIAMLACLLSLSAHATTYTVINTNNAGAGSLRQAIIDANNDPADDTIDFNIGGDTNIIKILTTLPEITDSGTINGLPLGSVILEDGGSADKTTTGLVINASLVTVQGLVIRGFEQPGIVLNGSLNTIVSNSITGSDKQGIDIEEASQNTIRQNTITGNGEDGIFVWNTAVRNTITQNSIYANGDNQHFGIDLFDLDFNGGITENDLPCDADGGGNNLQNFPVLTSADSDGTNTTITGSLPSAASSTFTIEFFSSDECHRDGKTYLGSTNVTTDAECHGVFTVTLPVALADGTPLTATATDAIGNTSEFSDCFPVTGPQPHDLAVMSLKAPKKVTLKTGVTPTKSSKVQVDIQNFSAHEETIDDFATLSNLVTLVIESLATNCAAPTAELQPPKAFPVILKPNGKLKLTYLVTIDCANDPLATSKEVDHSDYRYTANVNHAVLDGNADTNPPNDDCPREPSGSDKGCGGKDPVTKQLGADVLTDVVVK